MNQVWGNLIDNAIDALANGGRVEVIAARESQSVMVLVRDDGPGIPTEIRDQIFDPFFTTKPLGQGTGLGLDIAKRLVRHNDGAIGFESQPGRTEFRVTIPLLEIYCLSGCFSRTLSVVFQPLDGLGRSEAARIWR
ncbi:MAG: ATP-binding protein [Edaphobacter sp.]